MGVINRVVFICAGSDTPEGLRIKELTSTEGSPEHVAVSLAPIYAPAADTGLRCYIAGSVFGF